MKLDVSLLALLFASLFTACGPDSRPGQIDAGPMLEAGAPHEDASAPDAAIDAATPIDASSPDASPPDASPPDDAGPPTCTPTAAQGIFVAATDVMGGVPYGLGYPPYAVDGCRLVYVARAASGTAPSDLVLRDLVTGTEVVIAPASEMPSRPAIAGDLVAWEATCGSQRCVRVKTASGVITIAGAFDHAGEPRVAADTVVFTAWLSADAAGDTDVLLYTPSTGALAVVATGPGQQRFADVSTTHVAWSDFSEGPSGAFLEMDADAADVVVLDRATSSAIVRKQPGKQAFPMLGASSKIAYLDWGLVHPEPKFSEYDLRLGDLTSTAATDVLVEHIVTQVPYVRPIARGSLLEWVAAPFTQAAELRRRRVDLGAPVEIVSTFPGATVFGPTATESITLLAATPLAGGYVTLRAFAR